MAKKPLTLLNGMKVAHGRPKPFAEAGRIVQDDPVTAHKKRQKVSARKGVLTGDFY